MELLRARHAAVIAKGPRSPIAASSPAPAEPINVGDNYIVKGKAVIITRIGLESERLEGYKAATIDAALKALAEMRKNSASDSDSLSALDLFLQEFGFLPGKEGEIWARSVWGGEEFQVDVNGDKLLGMDIDAVQFVSDNKTIMGLVYNNGGATMIRQSRPDWKGCKPPAREEKSTIFSTLTSGSLVSVPKRCAAQGETLQGAKRRDNDA